MSDLTISSAWILVLSFLLAVARPVPTLAEPGARLKVVCTLTTLESLVNEVGGERVETVSLAKGDQDPRFVQPTPVLMQKTRNADLFVQVSLSLERWADNVVNGSGTTGIAIGGPGRVIASAGLSPLEVPPVITHAQGDIHVQGNPYFWLDPVRAKLVAENIVRALEAKDPSGKEYFKARLKAFEDRIDIALYGEDLLKAIGAKHLDDLILDGRLWPFLEANEAGGKKLSSVAGGWLKRGLPFRGSKAIEYHMVWAYFARTFGLDLRGTIEERIGIPPGQQYLQKITQQVRNEGIKLILVDNFYDPTLPLKVAKEAGGRVVVLPSQVRGEEGIKDYFELMDYIVGKIERELEEAKKPSPAERS